MDIKKVARICKIFSVETRLRIIELLREKPLCVNALARRLDVTPAAVSQHLRILRDADMVVADKKGYFVHYRLNSDVLNLLELDRVIFSDDEG